MRAFIIIEEMFAMIGKKAENEEYHIKEHTTPGILENFKGFEDIICFYIPKDRIHKDNKCKDYSAINAVG